MNTTRSNDFDNVAKVYDRLVWLFFGKSMIFAQTVHLKSILPNANVLIIGGGTGWLLEELLIQNSTCRIWYVEASWNMLELTKKRVKKSSCLIHFIHGTESSVPVNIKYDVVITNFFLDLFTSESCSRVVSKIKSHLHSKSLWIVTDFKNTTWWQHVLLEVMYTFFKLTSAIEATKLPEWETLLRHEGLIELKSVFFYNRFIKSSLLAFGDGNDRV